MEAGESRIAFLRERVEAVKDEPGTATFAVPFRQGRVDLPKIQVPIGFPLYRIESGRTHRAQSRYTEERGLDDGFFTDPESEEVQQAQHEILLEMVDEQGLRENLLRNPQQDPVVLTYDGFIVDGNRRTAAIRDEGQVEHLTAVVLDQTAEASDIYETELEFQMAEQTKADYNWVDELLHIRLGVDSLYASRAPDDVIRSIAERMNRSEEDVQDDIGRLALVDVYLEWLEHPNKYHRIATEGPGSAEQSFIELYDRLDRPAFRNLAEAHRKAIREACFSVIAEDGGYKDVRRVADMLKARPADFVEGLRGELEQDLAARLDEVPEPSASQGDGDGDLLDELAEAEDSGGAAEGAAVLNVTASADSGRVAEKLIDVAEDLDEQRREAQQQLEPWRRVRRAANTLEGVQLDSDTPRLEEIAEHLARVVAEADRLSKELEEHGSGE